MTTNTTEEWTNMANTMAKNWTEMSTQMWKSWFDIVTTFPTPDKLMTATSETSEAFVSNRDLFIKFLELSATAWKEMLPKVESGDEWQSVLDKYTEQLRQQFTTFSTSTDKITEDTTKLWELYLKDIQKFSQLWGNPLGLSLEPLRKISFGNTDGWIEINNIYWDLYQRCLGNFVQTPTLGLNRELNGKLLNGFDAWTKLYQATVNYQVVISDIQVRSFDALMKELVALAEKGEKVESWRDFHRIWSQVADEVFAETFKSEDNLKLRGEFINALNAYKVYQQELIELYLKMFNAPIRSEVDEIHKNVYDLGKEVKEMKKLRQQVEDLTKEVAELRKPGAEA